MKSALVCLLVLATGAMGAFATGITGRTYINDEHQFQISLPDDLKEWIVTDQEPDVGVVVMDDSVSAVFAVMIESVPEPVVLEDFVNLTLFFTAVLFNDWKQESRQALKIDGVEAIEVVYTSKSEGISVRFIQWFIIKGNTVYSMIGTALGDPFPFPFQAFRSIVNTFEFLPLTEAISVETGDKMFTTWGTLKR